MLIAIGSTNPIKIQAVEDVVRGYPQFAHAAFTPIAAASEISEQPLNLEEIIRGAKNRAKNAFDKLSSCRYSFGIESGLFEAPGSRTGYLEACICSIYDRKNFHLGLSCGFEVPPAILQHILNENLDLSQAAHRSGITNNPTLGSAEGIIGILTKGRIDRKSYTKQAVTTAMIQLENADWYIQEN